jgi:predicted DNA-binding transcriptional regulator AlpA
MLNSELRGVGEVLAGGEALLKAEQVAQMLNLRTKRVYELDLPTVKLGRKTYRYRLSDVVEYVKARSTSLRTMREKAA